MEHRNPLWWNRSCCRFQRLYWSRVDISMSGGGDQRGSWRRTANSFGWSLAPSLTMIASICSKGSSKEEHIQNITKQRKQFDFISLTGFNPLPLVFPWFVIETTRRSMPIHGRKSWRYTGWVGQRRSLECRCSYRTRRDGSSRHAHCTLGYIRYNVMA